MIQTPTIADLHRQWVEAFSSHELDRHMQLYTEDAVLFGSVDALQIGREAIRTYFGNRPPTIRVGRYPMPRVAELGPHIATTAGHVDFVDGGAVIPYRMTWVLVQSEGNWRIAQHHGSPRQAI